MSETLTESPESLMSETERETRRKEIIVRLAELSKTIPGGSADNNIYFVEAKALDAELLKLFPVNSTRQEPIRENQPERRGDFGTREAIDRLLKDVRSEPKK